MGIFGISNSPPDAFGQALRFDLTPHLGAKLPLAGRFRHQSRPIEHACQLMVAQPGPTQKLGHATGTQVVSVALQLDERVDLFVRKLLGVMQVAAKGPVPVVLGVTGSACDGAPTIPDTGPPPG